MSRFAADLQRFAQKVADNADLVVAHVVLEIGKSLVFKSPVGDPTLWKSPAPKGYVGGTFRASWQHGTVSMPGAQEFSPDPAGSATVGRIGASIGTHPAGLVHYIVNHQPYARPLEYGWSKQAPNGMVGVTVLEFEQYIDAAVRRVK